MVQTLRNQIKSYKIQIEENVGTTIKVDSPLLTPLPRHAAWQYTRFHKRQHSTTTACEKIRHTSYQNPILLVGEAVACRRLGGLVNKLELAWLEGSDGTAKQMSTLSEHRRHGSKPCIETQSGKTTWDTNHSLERHGLGSVETDTSHVIETRSDREPILMGPIPRGHFNPPDDPDTPKLRYILDKIIKRICVPPRILTSKRSSSCS